MFGGILVEMETVMMVMDQTDHHQDQGPLFWKLYSLLVPAKIPYGNFVIMALLH